MPTSLLSLPDELLALIVDEAVGEYAPKLYKQRQETCRALSLVSKRVGAVAQVKLLEAVHLPFGTLYELTSAQVDKVLTPGRARALFIASISRRAFMFDIATFAAVRDLRLSSLRSIRLDDIAQLPELRVLVLSECELVASRPVFALKLERLVLYFCDVEIRSCSRPFAVAGCPRLEHLYLAVPHDSACSVSDGLLARVDALGLELLDVGNDIGGWTSALTADAVSRGALLDETLFDLLSGEINVLPMHVEDVKHLRVHVEPTCTTHDSAPDAERLADLADLLEATFPSLKTLYLPVALDNSHVMHHRHMHSAMTALVNACARQHVEIVFEHALNADDSGEDRASPHFEARCGGIKAERSAAQGKKVEQGGARAA
ncbi:hypothetical protein JCM8208_006556 [Rhodotorula glutinis]